jgi:hypothetical protein
VRGREARLCRRGVTALGEVGVALAFGRVVVVVLDIQSADATVHLTDNVMLPAADRIPPSGYPPLSPG